MNSDSYWAGRLETLNEAMLGKGEKYINAMNTEYEKAMASIQKDIDAFYGRFAKNNSVDLATARQMLKAGELKEFRWTVQDYIKAGKENAIDQRWMKELENASIKVRMSRLEALQTQMRQHIEVLAAKRQTGTGGVLGSVYKDGYYKSVFELQKGTGVGASFAKVDQRQIDSMLSTPWAPDGSNFSARIWADRTKLVHELQKALTQSLIRGDLKDKVITAFAERMGVSRSSAARLILTESAYFSGQSRLAAYKELGVEQYKYTATLDKRTSSICRQMDGEVFQLDEAKAGVNYPPVHSHCRSTTIPHYEDNVQERAARDDDGNTYDVPGDMTYKEWEKQHAPEAADSQTKTEIIKSVEPPRVQQSGVVEEPAGTPNRRYNPKASYHIDLPKVPEETLEQLADINRSIVREGHKKSKETAVLIDMAGKELERATGSINKVKFSESMDQVLRKADSNSVILTHNHPKGSRINVKDLQNLAVYDSLHSVIAVGHDGGVSAVSSAGQAVSLAVFNDVMIKIAKQVKDELQSSSRYAIMSSSEKLAYSDYMLLQSIITVLGWSYVEDFTAARSPNWGH